MRHLPIAETEKRLVREIACVDCYHRPKGSETLGPQVPRSCEGQCPIFVHLPKLVQLAGHIGDRPGETERAVKDQVCMGCGLSESSGDYCADYTARTCPLSRYSAAIVSRLQRLMPFTPDI